MHEHTMEALLTYLRNAEADANAKLDKLYHREQNSGELDEFARGYQNGRVAELHTVLECLRNVEDKS